MIFLFFFTLSSLRLLRKAHPVTFAWIYIALGWMAVSMILLHIWLATSTIESTIARIILALAIGIGLLNAICRKRRSKVGRATKLVREDATIVKLTSKVRAHAGAYFYIYFHETSLWHRYRGLPLVLHGWNSPESLNWHGDKRQMSELSFMIESGHLSSKLLEKETTVTIEGPYGKNLGLEQFEHAVLVAEGNGIAACIPLVAAILEKIGDRKDKSSSDPSKRITLFWATRDISQQNSMTERFNELIDLQSRFCTLNIIVITPATKPSQSDLSRKMAKGSWESILEFRLNKILHTQPEHKSLVTTGKCITTLKMSSLINFSLWHLCSSQNCSENHTESFPKIYFP